MTVHSSGRGARAPLMTALVVVLAMSTLVGTAGAAAANTDFKDVPVEHQFRTEIAWLADQRVTTGYSDGSFRPKESVSREAFAAFLYRLAGQPAVRVPARSPFKDVSTGAQFYREIVWLSEAGITTGWSDRTFRPKDKISREAIAAFLYRYEGKPTFSAPRKSPFSDMTTRAKFYKEVTWLADSGMTTGYADGTFRPKSNVSREAIAAFLYRGNSLLRGNGTFRVGSRIPAGVYTAVVAGSDYGYGLCYWERRSDTSSSFEGIIANGITDVGRVVVEILRTDVAFHTDGCSGWTPLRKVSPSATSVGEGTHAVGFHMLPGVYSARGGTGCYWEVVSDFTGDWEALIENEYIDGRPAEVRVYDGEGFTTEGCGVWSRISG